jgi:hypothetical protein
MPNEEREPEENQDDRRLVDAGIVAETLPSSLSEEDLILFQPAIQQTVQTQQFLQMAQQQFNQAQVNVAASQHLLRYLVTHFRAKYKMNDGDDVDEDGKIIRKE